MLEKLAQASKTNPALAAELAEVNTKLLAIAKKYPIELSPEEIEGVNAGWCIFSGGGEWCIFAG